MSRTLRLAPRPRPPLRRLSALLSGLLAVSFVTAACSSSPSGDTGPPAYSVSDEVTARVLPQLASVGEDTEAADDAEWVVEARIDDVDAGTPVELLARDGTDAWESVAETETDDSGEVALTTDATGTMRVVVGDGDDAVGAEVSTEDAPEATFTDDFDKNSVDVEDGSWFTRDQGYVGVRTCSKADASAAKVLDGVLRLSVFDDPDRGADCRLKGKRKQFDYRLNGHVGTEGVQSFTYGFAAARVKAQAARGQHAAFWMQAEGGQTEGGPEVGGAEIDVMEYFGDDHPEGGLTSFTYWLDEAGKQKTDGGWVRDLDQYGEDWATQFHVFSVEWTPEEYVFRIDGQVTHRLEGPTSGRPEFLILSLLSSDYELARFNGELPEHMNVDWARVWETGPS